MQDRPDARELVEAVAGFLEKEMVPTVTDPRLKFRTLVAANVLAIVARELAAGEGPLRAEWEGLTRLLDKPGQPRPTSDRELRDAVLEMNRELAARVRAGAADADPLYTAVLDHAEQTIVDKLRIANPRLLERLTK